MSFVTFSFYCIYLWLRYVAHTRAPSRSIEKKNDSETFHSFRCQRGVPPFTSNTFDSEKLWYNGLIIINHKIIIMIVKATEITYKNTHTHQIISSITLEIWTRISFDYYYSFYNLIAHYHCCRRFDAWRFCVHNAYLTWLILPFGWRFDLKGLL